MASSIQLGISSPPSCPWLAAVSTFSMPTSCMLRAFNSENSTACSGSLSNPACTLLDKPSKLQATAGCAMNVLTSNWSCKDSKASVTVRTTGSTASPGRLLSGTVTCSVRLAEPSLASQEISNDSPAGRSRSTWLPEASSHKMASFLPEWAVTLNLPGCNPSCALNEQATGLAALRFRSNLHTSLPSKS